MRYIMLIYSQEVPGGPPPEEIENLKRAHTAVMKESRQKGVLVGYDALKPTASATTVRMKGAAPIITDGPFAETKEQLAGYYIIECKDLDEAIEWARKIPSNCKGYEGCIEVRPIFELSWRI
ncbi:MAG TPA: YciI family protein [Candidatus Acidoferrales bacterium]|nr:YciI family protein [Candidatus Acidoferrales bacterium]